MIAPSVLQSDSLVQFPVCLAPALSCLNYIPLHFEPNDAAPTRAAVRNVFRSNTDPLYHF